MGALFCTFLHGNESRFAQLRACMRRHGLPALPADFGLSDADFAEVVEHAPGTRPDRYTILEHLALSPAEVRARIKEYTDAVAG
jgi:glycerol-1-phosphate dehydrogenase [NAD(P)+]